MKTLNGGETLFVLSPDLSIKEVFVVQTKRKYAYAKDENGSEVVIGRWSQDGRWCLKKPKSQPQDYYFENFEEAEAYRREIVEEFDPDRMPAPQWTKTDWTKKELQDLFLLGVEKGREGYGIPPEPDNLGSIALAKGMKFGLTLKIQMDETVEYLMRQQEAASAEMARRFRNAQAARLREIEKFE